MDDTYNSITMFAPIAIETSINSCRYGVPFGGSFSWMIIVFLSNDSGQHPWAPFQAAIIGFPLIIVCDVALFIPALVISYLLNPRFLRY
jgi:hypothetical protein